MVKYLVGRLADPVLGLATGVFAYYLWETDPRNAPVRPQGRTLLDLSRRWWNDERPSRILYSGPSPFGDRVERGDFKVV